jgi:hypothetical protein
MIQDKISIRKEIKIIRKIARDIEMHPGFNRLVTKQLQTYQD